MPSVNSWLQNAKQQLDQAGIESARLDAELLLSHFLSCSRSSLLARLNDRLPPLLVPVLTSALKRRLQREPLAYICGKVEFWGLEFTVSPAVLIPRPETEDLVDYIVTTVSKKAAVHDVGTGSGAIAIAVKHSRPDLVVSASDISPAALAIAKANAKKLSCDINFTVSDLLIGVTVDPEVIVANLPYLSVDQKRSPETQFEPRLALFAETRGLEYYTRLLQEGLPASLKQLVLEAEPNQLSALLELAKETHHLTLLKSQRFLHVFIRN